MDFQQAVKTCLVDKYANFQGRASRPEFWWFFLSQVGIYLVTSALHPLLYFIAVVALLLPAVGAGVRRLHDIGRSGWWMLAGLIPLVGWILMVYWAVQPGDPGSNAFGEPPADAPPAAPGEA